jgi:hypothetical protein
MQTIEATSSDNKMTAIERALAAAKARKAASGDTSQTTAVAGDKKKERAPKAAKPSEADREAARAARDAARVERLNAKAAALAAEAESKAAKKLERAAAKAARAAEKAAEKAAKKPAHTKKVDKARAKLPPLEASATALFGEVTANLSSSQIDALAQHLLLHNRMTATLTATSSPRLPVGATVTITGGETKFIGKVGTVVHSHKLRAKVAVPGYDKVVYIYNGQAVITEPLAAAV